MYSDDSLQNVSEDEVATILSTLKSLLPTSVHAYYFIDSLLKWKKKVPEVDIGILCPEGGHKSGSVFFYVMVFDHLVFSAFIWSENGEQALSDALVRTKRFQNGDYKYVWVTCMNYKVWSIMEPILPAVLKQCSSPKIGNDQIFWLPADKALQFHIKIPAGVHLAELKEEHAELINNLWPYSSEGSKKLIEMMTWVNFGRGLFKSDGELVAWAFYWFFGALGIAHTLANERRKGYGKVVVQAVCKEMASRGLDIHINIVENNTASEKFFTSLGFEHAFNCIWAVYNVID
ncbi:hypothetical protein O3M35_001274 [Rhynocoris fuscipes]|uniref:N-acetyltransferase domain-containing protein n=1 Tax=Rhynocoris fuscipes TaxID=488301 RepID=A0AAW1DRY8_9HEMI